MKKILSFAMVALLTLALAACGQNQNDTGTGSTAPSASASTGSDTPIQSTKDSLTMITILETESLDPYAALYADKTVPRMMFDTLLNYDENGNHIACLAESWEDDGRDVTLKLRQDVTFTNGEPFTAADVMYAYEQYAANPSFAAKISIIGTCEKLDDYTVVFHKPKPYSPILAVFAETFHVVSSKAHAASPEAFAKNPVGSGPYTFVSQGADGAIVFEANEDYFLGAPLIKHVTIKPPVEPSTAVIALQAGEVDLVANLPMAQKKIIDNDQKLTFIEGKGWAMSMLILCGDKFADNNLRQAIYYALDLDSMVLIGNEGVGQPATNLGTQLIMRDFEGKVPFGEFNVDKAKEYLADSQYAAGTEFTLSVVPEYVSAAQVVQANLATIGITVNVEQLSLNALYEKMFNGTIEMTVTYIGTSTSTVESIIEGYESTPFDMMLHETPEIADIIAKLQGEFDTAKSAELVLEGLQLVKDNADLIPLYEMPSTVAYAENLGGVQDFFASSYLYYVNQMYFK